MSTISKPAEAIVPKPWQTGLAPVYIGIFLWIAFFDQIGRKALPLGALGGAFLGVFVAGPLAYLFLFRSSALWGHRSGKPLDVLATATFGVSGAKVVPGFLLGVAQVILFAVAVGYAVELTFQGLILGGLIDPRSVKAGSGSGAFTRSPLYLATVLFWAVATALVSMRFTRWIGYLMQFFPIFPALMLGGAMIATLNGLRTFQPINLLPPSTNPNLPTFLLTLQWVFAFSSMAGVMGADWGLGSLTLRDVKLGGWVGMAFAPSIVAILALIAVAGFEGSKMAPKMTEEKPVYRPQGPSIEAAGVSFLNPPSPGLEVPAYSFRGVMTGAFPGRLGALILVTFGLGSLAPAVYASFAFGNRFKELGPGISRFAWTMMGTAAAWLIVVGGWYDRTETIFNILGAVFAPVAGAFAADYRRHKGQWPGPRTGTNPAGLLAWGVGLTVGLCPTIGQTFGADRLTNVQPAAILAFLASYLTYEVLAMIRFESKPVPEIPA